MFSWKVRFLIVGILFLVPVLVSGKTWIVDDDGGSGVDFTEIRPAIAAASPGDVILVRDGDYTGFTLFKDLILAADTGHRPDVKGDCTVTGISVQAVISGFDLERLFINQSTGAIVVDDCACVTTSHYEMVMIEQCALVLLSRCHVEYVYGGDLGRPAVKVTESEVILAECTLFGHDGSDGIMADPPGDGGEGIEAKLSTLYVQATTCTGGKGGDYSGDDYFAGDGGHAVKIDECTLHLFGLASHLIEGGKGGICNTWPYFGETGDGIRASWSTIAYSGIDLSNINNVNQTSVVTEVQPEVPVITMTGTGQLGSSLDVALHGPQGADYILFTSLSAGANSLGGLYTDLLLDPSILLYMTSGSLPVTHTYQIPPTALAYRGVLFHFQAYVIAGPDRFLSTSAAFVVR